MPECENIPDFIRRIKRHSVGRSANNTDECLSDGHFSYFSLLLAGQPPPGALSLLEAALGGLSLGVELFPVG